MPLHQPHFPASSTIFPTCFFDSNSAWASLALLPTFLVWKEIEKGELVSVMTDYTVPGFNAYAVYPQTRYLSQRVRTFIDFLSDRFGGAPYWDKNI